jgi:hypothetical protein
MTQNNPLTERLNELLKTPAICYDAPLKANVAQYLLDEAKEYGGGDSRLVEVTKSLLENGCAGGNVDHLIYYKDSHAYFDLFYNCIENLRGGFEEAVGVGLKIDGDIKHFYACFAFECMVRDISKEFSLVD